MLLRGYTLIATALALTGCASTSFAPPDVALQKPATPTFDDAIQEVDSFIVAYRNSAREAANGRQFFEVPAFLGTVGAVTATAFGASSDVTIASGATGAILGGGKTYYAPRDKAGMYRSALKALYCIQQTAMGVKPFVDAAPSSDARIAAEATNGSPTSYYYLVRNAALSVEEILAGRLSNAGSVTDAAGIAAEYEKQVKELVRLEAEAHTSVDKNAKAMGLSLTNSVSDTDLSKLNSLQPKLQLCILMTKS